MKTLKLGTRGSQLAQVQSQWVAHRLQEACPDVKVEMVIIQTRGDREQSQPLPEIGGKGLFTQELDQSLLDGSIDIAVHSMKDLPTETTPGLSILAVPQREDDRDALICREGVKFQDLPSRSRVGTSSLRRLAQLKHSRGDLRYLDIRGNVGTRIRKMQRGDYDAIILAAAGARRLGLADLITEYFDHQVMLPAVGQGALAVTGRTDDNQTGEILSKISDPAAKQETIAERALLAALGGGCHVPIAARAIVNGSEMQLAGLVISPDGSRVIRDQISGSANDPQQLGRELGRRLLDAGAKAILDELG